MTKEMPFGVKYARGVNLVGIVIFILIGLCMAGIAIPNFLRGAEEAGGTASPMHLIIVGLIAIVIGLIPAFLLVLLNRALLQLDARAKVFQIIYSCISLLAFPVGTILYGISLYYMLFDSKTKEAFQTSLKEGTV